MLWSSTSTRNLQSSLKGSTRLSSRIFLMTSTLTGGLFQVSLWLAGSWMCLVHGNRHTSEEGKKWNTYNILEHRQNVLLQHLKVGGDMMMSSLNLSLFQMKSDAIIPTCLSQMKKSILYQSRLQKQLQAISNWLLFINSDITVKVVTDTKHENIKTLCPLYHLCLSSLARLTTGIVQKISVFSDPVQRNPLETRWQ